MKFPFDELEFCVYSYRYSYRCYFALFGALNIIRGSDSDRNGGIQHSEMNIGTQNKTTTIDFRCIGILCLSFYSLSINVQIFHFVYIRNFKAERIYYSLYAIRLVGLVISFMAFWREATIIYISFISILFLSLLSRIMRSLELYFR